MSEIPTPSNEPAPRTVRSLAELAQDPIATKRLGVLRALFQAHDTGRIGDEAYTGSAADIASHFSIEDIPHVLDATLGEAKAHQAQGKSHNTHP